MTRRWREGCGGRLRRQFVENLYNRALPGENRDTPCGREGSKGSKGSEGSTGSGGRPSKGRGAIMIKPLQPGFARGKTGKPPFGRGKSPLWWLAPPPLPRWEACHWIFGSLRPPTNPVPLPPLFEGALWVLSTVPHDTRGKRRAVYSAPCIGWQGNTIRRGA